MTQQWYMENGYVIRNNYQRQMLEVYYDDKIIYEEEFISVHDYGTLPRLKSDPLNGNFYEIIYPICLKHKRESVIDSLLNDSDIGYEE